VPRPFWGKLFTHPIIGIPYAKLLIKFDVSSSYSFKDILVRLPENLGVTWHKPRPFWGKLFARPLSFPKTKLCTKFAVHSSSSFEDMFDHMPKILGVTWPKSCPLWGKLFMHLVRIPCAICVQFFNDIQCMLVLYPRTHVCCTIRPTAVPSSYIATRRLLTASRRQLTKYARRADDLRQLGVVQHSLQQVDISCWCVTSVNYHSGETVHLLLQPTVVQKHTHRQLLQNNRASCGVLQWQNKTESTVTCLVVRLLYLQLL